MAQCQTKRASNVGLGEFKSEVAVTVCEVQIQRNWRLWSRGNDGGAASGGSFDQGTRMLTFACQASRRRLGTTLLRRLS
jgi:hypothetical protein